MKSDRFTTIKNQTIGLSEALTKGLTRFSGPSRVGVLIATDVAGPLFVYDPDGLFEEHWSELENDFVNQQRVSVRCKNVHKYASDQLSSTEAPKISGLLGVEAVSKAVPYQCWYTEDHPHNCNAEPTIQWLEHAARLLHYDVLSESIPIASYDTLKGFALNAIYSCLSSKLNVAHGTNHMIFTTQESVIDLLEAILALSLTREEGKRAKGRLAFINASNVIHPSPPADSVQYLAKFPKHDAPESGRPKHLRKLLTAIEATEGAYLVADYKKVLGIGTGLIPPRAILATFEEGRGDLVFDGQTICTFSDGRFSSKRRAPDIRPLEAMLFAQNMQNTQAVKSVIAALIESAVRHRHGCTIVLDLKDSENPPSGQMIGDPLDLNVPQNLSLAKSMAMIDGALHLDFKVRLCRFGCLLDGLSVPALEDRERGARFNSAVRYTRAHGDKLVVIVSEDGPVSAFFEGRNLLATPKRLPKEANRLRGLTPITDWLKVKASSSKP